jgi:putative transposase
VNKSDIRVIIVVSVAGLSFACRSLYRDTAKPTKSGVEATKTYACPALPPTFKKTDLIGTWVASYSLQDRDILTLREDGTYKQIYADPDADQRYESGWQEWWIERRESGYIRLHLKRMRRAGEIESIFNREGGGIDPDLFTAIDYCENEVGRVRFQRTIFATTASFLRKALAMPEYRRSRIEGGTYFFTVVTYERRQILTTAETRALLHSAWLDVCHRFPFKTIAVCLLPDHIHCIWSLPSGDANYSVRWKEIKRLFTKGFHSSIGSGEIRSESRLKRAEAAIWQRRFWEHTIRDQDDLYRHIDYIHYNPVKHGHVNRVVDWPWSSFHRYVKAGNYLSDWGESVAQNVIKMECGE